MDETLSREVQSITKHLDVIRSMLRRRGLADMAASGLPSQQINAIKELTKEDGLTLKQLSARMGLAHSTVSGIVDRLEQKNLLHRRPDPRDRRCSRIYLDESVVKYQSYQAPSQRTELLIAALRRARPGERALILGGLAALQCLMEAEMESDVDNAGSPR